MAVPLFNSNGRSTAGSTVEWQRSIHLGQFRRFRRPIFGGGALAKNLRNEPKASSRRAKLRNEPKARATRDYYESDLTSSPCSLRHGRRERCAAAM